MTKAVVEAVDRVFRPGFKYSKAEVLLVNLCQKGEYTEDLFSTSQPQACEKVMGVLDAIKARCSRLMDRVALLDVAWHEHLCMAQPKSGLICE
jgi:DNA polymerase V